MIMPTKHTSIEQSFLGFGAHILKSLGDGFTDNGLTIDELWTNYNRDFSTGEYNAKQSFDNLLLTVSFLFSINAIFDDDGKIKRCN